jgi:hypothetical protein
MVQGCPALYVVQGGIGKKQTLENVGSTRIKQREALPPGLYFGLEKAKKP